MSAGGWAARAAAGLRAAWRFLRECSGDAAYERYRAGARGRPLSAEEFWLDELRRRYDQVSRCC